MVARSIASFTACKSGPCYWQQRYSKQQKMPRLGASWKLCLAIQRSDCRDISALSTNVTPSLGRTQRGPKAGKNHAAFELSFKSISMMQSIHASLTSSVLSWSSTTKVVSWLHLSFRGHRPYLFRSDDGSCSELAPGLMFDDFLPIPDAESLPFYPLVLKLVVSVRQNLPRKCSRTSRRCLSTFLFAVFGIQIDIAWFTWFCGHVSCFDLFST